MNDEPLAKIGITCPVCGEDVDVEVRHVGATAVCPNCRNVITETKPRNEQKEKPKRQKTKPPKFEPTHGRTYRAIRLVIVLGMMWLIASALAYWKLRTEINADVQELETRFDKTELTVRSPFPFCISTEIRGTSKKGGIIGKVATTHYYVWFFGYKRTIPVKEAPPYMTWVWGDKSSKNSK